MTSVTTSVSPAEDTDRTERQRDRHACLFVVLLLLGVYLFTMGGHSYSVDDETYLAGTRSLLARTTVINPSPDLVGILSLPKHKNGGLTTAAPVGTLMQIMHNGVKVKAGGYYGVWMAEIIERLGGLHEPQEELAFHDVVERLAQSTTTPTIVEVGAFWSYYSLWALQRMPNGVLLLLVVPVSALISAAVLWRRSGWTIRRQEVHLNN